MNYFEMHFLFIFIIIAGSVVAIDQNCPKTDTIKTCYFDYFKSLKIPTDNFPAYKDYSKIFNEYNTPEHLTEFCVYVNNLTKCLGRHSCVSPDGFRKLKVTGQDVFDYPWNFGIIEYTCGAGLQNWKNIIDCITKNAAAITDELRKCEITYETTNQTCQDEINLLGCSYDLHKKDCGQVAWNFACAADKKGMHYSTSDCINSMPNCDVPISTTTSEISSTTITSGTDDSIISPFSVLALTIFSLLCM